MTAIAVERYMFSVDEVVASILPNIGRAREVELRVDADGYVVIDVVAPSEPKVPAHENHSAPPQEDTPESRPDETAGSEETSEQTVPETGQREEEARGFCRTPLFRAFLEVKTEEAALKVLAERCHVKSLTDLDRTRSNGMNFRHVREEYEAWKIS